MTATSNLQSQISRLASAREKLDRKLSSLRKKAQSDRPWNLCLRCGFRWQGLWLDRSPRYCARCHSAGWNIPPVLQNSRRPTDPPNPRWGKKKKQQAREAEPPNDSSATKFEHQILSASVSIVPTPTAEIDDALDMPSAWRRPPVFAIGLPPPPALDTGLPPLPRLDEPMGEEFARPTVVEQYPPVEEPQPDEILERPVEEEESHDPVPEPDPEPSSGG